MADALSQRPPSTMANVGMLVALGYSPALAPDRLQVTTGSGIEFVPRLPLLKVMALGHERVDLPVLAHTLPPSVRRPVPLTEGLGLTLDRSAPTIVFNGEQCC